MSSHEKEGNKKMPTYTNTESNSYITPSLATSLLLSILCRHLDISMYYAFMYCVFTAYMNSKTKM